MTDCTCTNFPASLGNVTFGASVGVGVSAAPLTNLVVEGTTGLHVRSTAGSPEGGRVTFFGDGTGWHLYVMARDDAGVEHPANLAILTLVDTGLVGVATNTPAYPLDVAGSVRATGPARLDSGVIFGMTSQAQAPGIHADGASLYLEANQGSLYLRPHGTGDNTNAAVLTAAGQLGIGTLTPQASALLDVAGTVHCTGLLLGGSMNLSGAIYDSSGQHARVDAGGCYYA